MCIVLLNDIERTLNSGIKHTPIHLLALLLLLVTLNSFAQTTTKAISWKPHIVELDNDLQQHKKLYCVGAFYKNIESKTPQLQIVKEYKGAFKFRSILISDIKTKELNALELSLIEKSEIESELQFEDHQINSNGVTYLKLKFCPLLEQNGKIHKVLSFKYKISGDRTAQRSFKTSTVSNSALTNGTWYKLAVVKTGIHQINAAFFATNGIDISSINPKNIRIFGNGTGILDEHPQSPYSQLKEIAIEVTGESDGTFDASDAVLFYAKGPGTWKKDENHNMISYRNHLYSDTAYYFLNFDQGAGKRISQQGQSSASNTKTFNSFDFLAKMEEDQTNLIQSGKKWLGDYYDNTTTQSYSFSIPNLSSSENIKLKTAYAVRSFSSAGNNINVSINGNPLYEIENIFSVSSAYASRYAYKVEKVDSTLVSSGTIGVSINFNKAQSSSVMWLDYIYLNAKSKLNFSAGQLSFRNLASVGDGQVSLFNINTSSSQKLWDVSDPWNTKAQASDFSGNTQSFKIETDSLKEFVIHNGSYLSPIYKGSISNQNILSLVNSEYILVCPPLFASAAQELVDFHKTHSGISANLVTTDQIYNEFSSGMQDITAIRNFMRYLYENSSSSMRPKYLMLMGDASYDYKDIAIEDNQNFVPSFQSEESYNPVATFCSDDYFGMVDDSVDIYDYKASVDIAVGRFPAKTATEVSNYVKKVKHYVNSSESEAVENCSTTKAVKTTYGPWKNQMLFAADDGNVDDNYSNSHLHQTELIVGSIEDIDSTYNFNKVYFDAYTKTAGAGGGSYPEVEREINDRIQNGSLLVSYIGHGGGAGWADERVLETDDINAWNNWDALPVFLTATCEFSRYDNPAKLSAGEQVILNPNGGAIAMITTVRLVYGGISNNIGFSINYFKNSLPDTVQQNSIGEALRLTKIQSSIGTNYNNRKFQLLGDPAIALALPKHKVKTTRIEDESGAVIDTLKALSKVKFKGTVHYLNGDKNSSFNGIVYPSVYDVYQKTYTLDNNNKNVVDSFDVQSNILFKGKATVKNGEFEFEFIVPKDISYTFGKGKIS